MVITFIMRMMIVIMILIREITLIMRNFTVIYFFHFIDDVHSFDILIEGREAQRMTNVCN